jgi:hypothetical protein
MFPAELEFISYEKSIDNLPDIYNIAFPPNKGVIYLRPPKEDMEKKDSTIMDLPTDNFFQR